MPKLSVIIITRNVEKHISECIKSATNVADEIVVYDCGSTDKTLEIAKKFNVKIHEDPIWRGFGRQRQEAQKIANYDWCLWIDADETITNSLASEIKDFLKTAKDNQVLSIRRRDFMFGREIKHSGYAKDYVVRLHNKNYTKFNNSMIRERLEIPKGTEIIKVESNILHFMCEHYYLLLNKQLKYSNEWAISHLKKRPSRCLAITPYLMAFITFIWKYIFLRGFLDGKIGVIACFAAASYVFNKYLALYTITNFKTNELQHPDESLKKIVGTPQDRYRNEKL